MSQVNNQVLLEALVENVLFVVSQPLSFEKLWELCSDFPNVTRDVLQQCLNHLLKKYESHSIELKKLPGGYVMQTRLQYAPWIQKLILEKPRKYSQAFLEVLAIIAYDQPVTRADIEQKRGVAIAPHMIKTLIEREWVKVVGYKDAPGKPALYATTTTFLDYFNLSSLDELLTTQVE